MNNQTDKKSSDPVFWFAVTTLIVFVTISIVRVTIAFKAGV